MNIEQGFTRDRATGLDADTARPRRRLWIVGGAVLLLVLIGAAWMLMRDGGAAPAGAGAAAGAQQAPRVTVIVPASQTVAATVTATGNLAARREMPVGVNGEGGLVSAVLVEPGQWVAAGQTLATIERSVQTQQAAQLAAQIVARRADARIAQTELDRSQALVSRGFISKADLDRKTATRDAANAQVRVAQALLGETQARIGRLNVRSPAAGLVLQRMVEPGQIVGAGAGALFRVARGGEMEMLARVSEQDLARLKVGVPATVTPVGTTTAFAGQIWQLSPIIDPVSRQGIARIALAYAPGLRPGGFASTAITSGSVDAPLLPESAVQSDDKGNFVYIVGADNKVARRSVTIGEVSNAGIAIVAGLNGRERVVASAGAFLNAGDVVVPERIAAAVAPSNAR